MATASPTAGEVGTCQQGIVGSLGAWGREEGQWEEDLFHCPFLTLGGNCWKAETRLKKFVSEAPLPG